MRRTFAITALLALLPLAARSQADSFSSLRFLLGDWTAIDTPPGESGSFTFTLSVEGHVIVRTNEARYSATAEHPASRHEDLLVIFSENGAIKADYFDNEGHVIRYRVQAPERNKAVFVSDAAPREPRYRLTYMTGSRGVLVGSFEVAPPGSPDGFTAYLSWKARKR